MQGSRRSRARLLRQAIGAAAIAASLSFALLAPSPRPASAAPTGSVLMSPATADIVPGETVSVSLIASSATDVHAVEFTVTFNSSVVQVVDADSISPGTQISPGVFPGSTAVGLASTNSVSGASIHYRYELNTAGVESDGSGTMAIVQFEGVLPGTSVVSWDDVVFEDAQGNTFLAAGSGMTINVGQPVDTPTPAPSATNTPVATSTPSATPTPGGSATASATPVATHTPAATSTAAGSPTATPTRTPAAAAGVTVIAGPPPQQRNGVDPSQTDRAQGLPSAGNDGPGIQWWRWVFFLAALMLGVAGWFFTFAVHFGDREPILVDRFDRRRRKRWK
jgi:hypothetical protein